MTVLKRLGRALFVLIVVVLRLVAVVAGIVAKLASAAAGRLVKQLERKATPRKKGKRKR